jgi:hypothetical protein
MAFNENSNTHMYHSHVPITTIYSSDQNHRFPLAVDVGGRDGAGRQGDTHTHTHDRPTFFTLFPAGGLSVLTDVT